MLFMAMVSEIELFCGHNQSGIYTASGCLLPVARKYDKA